VTGAGNFQEMTPEIDPKLRVDPLFQELMAEGLAMQERFAAGPVYARTGKGFLKSEGVAELQRLKAAENQRNTPTPVG
jgi:hypothetical protein